MPSATDIASAILVKTGRAAPLQGQHFTVAELLAQSKAAHQTYRHALTVQRDPTAAREALWMAARYRAEANQLDVDHADAAWSDDASTHVGQQFSHGEIHDDLLSFYLKELSK